MSNGDEIINRVSSIDKSAAARYTLVIIVAVTITWAGAVFVQRTYGVQWFPALNATGSVALTAILATLYFRQSKVLESQQDLLAAELNRGVREEHTEILRERVQEWHGNIDVDITEVDPWDAPSDNLPSVGRTSFKSAGTGEYHTGAGENFTTIPYRLQDDRYFRDLLENHATDLRRKARRIEVLQSEFEEAKSEFKEEFDYAKTVQHNQYTLQPEEYITEWVFEQLVRVERESLEFEEVREKMISKINRTGEHRKDSAIWIHKSAVGASRGVYKARFNSNQDIPTREDWDQFEIEVKELFGSMLDEIEADVPFDEIQLASELLDDGVRVTEDLRHTLVEYNGRLVYPGDCKYLQEAKIQSHEED